MTSLSCLLVGMLGSASLLADGPVDLFPELQAYVSARESEFGEISQDRKAELEKLGLYLQNRLRKDEPARITFIGTHNARTSHMAQIFGAVAAKHYGLDQVHAYSGGTEASKLNPRAAAAIERAGFRVLKTTDDDNPVYHIRYAENAPPLTAFSKVYNHAPNPPSYFGAVMTCTAADKSCPYVSGAEVRVSLPYDDPKAADDTPQEKQRYDETCRQISREVLYLFSLLRAR